MTYYLVKFRVQKSSNSKKHGRNKQRVFLDVFSPSENESKVHLPIKNLFPALESWWTFAVYNCIPGYKIQGPLSHMSCSISKSIRVTSPSFPARAHPSATSETRRIVLHTKFIVSDSEHAYYHIIPIFYVTYIYHWICNNE